MPALKTHFDNASDAYDAMREQYFPLVDIYFRLIKQPAARQDEYVLIRPLWGEPGDAFMPQTYRTDRDVNDMLLAKHIPASVFYNSQTDTKRMPTYKKDGVLAAWRREPTTQMKKLTGFNYVPGGPQVVDGLFNIYHDVSVKRVEPPNSQALYPILEHIRTNICNGKDTYANYLFQWLAHMVQKPAERPGTGIAVIGEQGTGKGLLTEFIKRMLGGPRNANTTASSSDTKSFNFALGNKLFVAFDEATFAGDRHQADFMKKLITEPRIRIEQKGIDAFEVDNFARVFITSNNMTSAVPVALGDRRWLIIECRDVVDPTFMRELVAYVADDRNAAYFKYYLESLPLEGFDPKQVPIQDTGFENKLQGAYRNDAVVGFLWDWLTAKDLTLTLTQKSNVGGDIIESEKLIAWDRKILFVWFYQLLQEACKFNFAICPGKPALGRRLRPFGIKVTRGAKGDTFIQLDHPSRVLNALKRTSRFDWPITPQQQDFINHAWGAKSVDELASTLQLHLDEDELDARRQSREQSEAELEASNREFMARFDIDFPDMDTGESQP